MAWTDFIDPESAETALKWMRAHPVVDGLGAAATSERAVNDLATGGVDAVNWCIGGHRECASWVHWPLCGERDTTNSAFMNMLAQRWLVRRMPDRCTIARSVADIEQARSAGKVAIIHGWQGAQPIEENLHLLEIFHELGLRILQICHSYDSIFGSGCFDSRDDGLKPHGREVVLMCNQMNLLIDCTHASERAALEMIEASDAPCILSHANPKAVREHPRNVSDLLIRECAEAGGVIGCPVYSDFVADTSTGRQPTVEDWVKCVDHTVEVAGIDHVAIGSDLCGNPDGAMWWDNSAWGGRRKPFDEDEIKGMLHRHENFPLLVAALVKRGYSEIEVAKIIGGNWLRVFRQVWGQ